MNKFYQKEMFLKYWDPTLSTACAEMPLKLLKWNFRPKQNKLRFALLWSANTRYETRFDECLFDDYTYLRRQKINRR